MDLFDKSERGETVDTRDLKSLDCDSHASSSLAVRTTNASKYNVAKTQLLGMNFSTASGKLLKIILFDLVVKLNLHYCYRCGKVINSVKEISIEHKESWQNSKNPKENFFDLNNIAFSHKVCNYKHTSQILNKKYKNRADQEKNYASIRLAKKKERYTSEKRRECYLKTGY